MGDFFSFKSMVTPYLMRITWLVSSFVLILAAYIWVTEYNGNTLIGLGVVFFGMFALRIITEFCIVIFRINETLTDINNSINSKGV